MKLKYLLRKTINVKTSYIVIVIITIFLFIVGCFSYAVFTATSEAKGALNIVTGNLYALIESIDLDQNKSITLAPNEEKIVTINLVNVNGRDAKLNLYYSTTTENIEIGYLASGDAAPTTEGYVLGKNGSETDTKRIYVKIINKDIVDATITFGSDAGLDNAELAFPNDVTKKSLDPIDATIDNNKILLAYEYNQELVSENYCVTGEEPTCKVTTCYKNNQKDSCAQGTIVKYAVNDNEVKYFYVLHDNGVNMTMQQRENTINNVAWYSDLLDNSKGPLTALASLEQVTNSWINVNNLTYTMGTTKFIENSNNYTGCYYDDDYKIRCDKSENFGYTLEEKTSKARMITAQEVATTNCLVMNEEQVDSNSNNGTCPIWMYNYLNGSLENNGTINGVDNSYWMMNANSNDATKAWTVTSKGSLYFDDTNAQNIGIRAVIEINK